MEKASRRRIVVYWRVVTIVASTVVVLATIINLVTSASNWWIPISAAFTRTAGITALRAITRDELGPSLG